VDDSLDKLAAKYKGRAMVVALDSSFGETAEEITAFKKENSLTLPVALDPKGIVADIFGAKMTTTTVIIDGEGKLRYFGQFLHGQEAMAEAALESILAGREVPHKQTKEHG
jgi:peroxiredoxin